MATPEEMAAAMKANMKEKTGRSLDEWLSITGGSGLEKHGQIVKMLKGDHGVTHGFPNLIAHETLRSSAGHAKEEDLVAAQYAGRKEGLRPIFELLIETVSAFGEDVEVAPKKSYVSLRRNKQFALIQPSTATRVDVGICSGSMVPTERLELSGSFNSMCSHRVRITSPEDVDDELRGWLAEAYEAS